MKKYLTFVLVSVFLVLMCGAPEGPEPETGEKTGENIGYGILTEAELQKFMKAVPVFKTEVEKLDKEWESLDSPSNMGTWLGQFSKTNQDIAELDTKLTAAGMPWNEFWPAFAKTMTAFIATTLEQSMAEMKDEMKGKESEIAEMEAKLNDPKVSDQEKEMIKASLEMMKAMQTSIEETEALYANVPQANKDLIQKHWDELNKVMEMD
jgi:Skp family chaperone for outer membrane proteins